MISLSQPCIGNFVRCISGEGFILPLHLNYICVFIDIFLYLINGVCINMFIHIIILTILLCLCILYNLNVGYTSSWYFALYLSSAYVIPPLRHGYICFYINIFVNVIPMVTAIYLCTSYDPLLGCATYWELCHAYFLYIICRSVFFILLDLHSQ